MRRDRGACAPCRRPFGSGRDGPETLVWGAHVRSSRASRAAGEDRHHRGLAAAGPRGPRLRALSRLADRLGGSRLPAGGQPGATRRRAARGCLPGATGSRHRDRGLLAGRGRSDGRRPRGHREGGGLAAWLGRPARAGRRPRLHRGRGRRARLRGHVPQLGRRRGDALRAALGRPHGPASARRGRSAAHPPGQPRRGRAGGHGDRDGGHHGRLPRRGHRGHGPHHAGHGGAGRRHPAADLPGARGRDRTPADHRRRLRGGPGDPRPAGHGRLADPLAA